MATKKLQILGSLGNDIELDESLTKEGAAADAKAVGDVVTQMNEKIDEAALKAYPIVENPGTVLAPDKYNVFGTVNELRITLETVNDGCAHEYCFEFTAGNEFVGMTITPAPKWVEEPVIEMNKTYQVSILRGIGVIVGA